MIQWPADEALIALIRRYYAGEAALWDVIRERVDDELRRRDIRYGAYHLRLRARSDGGYDVVVDEA